MIGKPGVRAASCTDAEVVAASLSEPERFAEIFERHFRPIHAYLARRVGRGLADDLASQVFVVAFQRRRSVRPGEESVRPWLYGIATNLLRNNARSERRHLAALARLGHATAPAVIEADGAARAGDRRRVAAALAALDRDQRDVVLLHCWEGLSHAEVAAALGVPAGTVASRLARGRRRLRTLLEATPEKEERR